MTGERESPVTHAETGLMLSSMQGESGPRMLQAALRDGRIERIVRGVYATVEARARHETFTLLAMAIGLTNRAAIVTGPAAAAIMGFAFIIPDDGRVDVLAIGSKDRRAGQSVARHAVKGIGTPYISRGIRVTSPARTALETCLLHGIKAGLVVVESMLWKGSVDAAVLAAELRAMGRRRGIGSARRVLALASDRSQSAGESLVRWCIDWSGAPATAAAGGHLRPAWKLARRGRLFLARTGAGHRIRRFGEDLRRTWGSRPGGQKAAREAEPSAACRDACHSRGVG